MSLHKDYLSFLRLLDNNTNRFGMVDYDIQKALEYSQKFVTLPNPDIPWTIKVHKERGSAFMKFKCAIESKDTTLQWYDWHQLVSKISPGLGCVDVMRNAYEHVAPHP